MLLVYDPKQLQAEPVSGTRDCVAGLWDVTWVQSSMFFVALNVECPHDCVGANSKSGVGMRWGGG